MSLYTRILEQDSGRPTIQVHALQAVLAEFSRGKLTQAQATAILQQLGGGVALNAGEISDLVAIRDLVTNIPVTGSVAAQADGRSQRAMKVLEIDQVWLLVDAGAPGYTTETEIRAKLGT